MQSAVDQTLMSGALGAGDRTATSEGDDRVVDADTEAPARSRRSGSTRRARDAEREASPPARGRKRRRMEEPVEEPAQ